MESISKEDLSDKQLLAIIRDLCGELAAIAADRGMDIMIPALQNTALASVRILVKIGGNKAAETEKRGVP